ncbi:MAG: hypothetical protein JXP34_02375, partial [Planctomycetes bacterium]|nr:hypothetical protein [Planctomycetota bacterium]
MIEGMCGSDFNASSVDKTEIRRRETMSTSATNRPATETRKTFGRKIDGARGALAVLPWVALALAGAPANASSPDIEDLVAAVEASPPVDACEVDLDDLRARAQAGLDFMAPGEAVIDVTCRRACDWSPAVESALRAHLVARYADMLDLLGDGWPGDALEAWGRDGARVAILSWNRSFDGDVPPVESVAVLDRDGTALFDTEVVSYITGAEPPDLSARDVSDGRREKAADCICKDTATVSKSQTFSGAFSSSVKMNWRVTLVSEVSPYIENDAGVLDIQTSEIRCWRSNSTGLFPPAGSPLVWFGVGGTPNDIYSKSVPFKSYVTLGNDVFASGVYGIDGSEGDTGINLDISVSAEYGVGISIGAQPANPYTLGAVSGRDDQLTFNDRVYTEVLPGFTYRGIFSDYGSLHLSNFRIRIDGNNLASETGSADVSMHVYNGYQAVGVLTLLGGTGVGSLGTNVRYIRGQALRDPSYSMFASKTAVGIGEDVDITVRVRNRSGAVALDGGQVSIDAGTLLGHLVPTTPTVLPLTSIAPYGSKDFVFRFQGATSGIVSPQGLVSDGQWGFPVPVSVTFGGPVGLDGQVIV